MNILCNLGLISARLSTLLSLIIFKIVTITFAIDNLSNKLGYQLKRDTYIKMHFETKPQTVSLLSNLVFSINANYNKHDKTFMQC